MIEPRYQTDRIKLYEGDASVLLPCIKTAPGLVLTDAPYFMWGHICETDRLERLDLEQEALWMADVFTATLLWMPDVRKMYPGLTLLFGEPHYVAIYMRVAHYLKWPMVGWWPSLRIKDHEEYLVAFADDWEEKHSVEAWLLRTEMPKILHANSYGQGKSATMLAEMIYCAPYGYVLDPFCGSGTTLSAAVVAGRSAIGIEASPEIARITEERLRKEAA